MGQAAHVAPGGGVDPGEVTTRARAHLARIATSVLMPEPSGFVKRTTCAACGANKELPSVREHLYCETVPGLDLVRVLPLGLAYRPGDEFFGESFRQHFGRMATRRRTPIWAAVGEPQPVPKTPEETETLRQRVQTLVDQASSARDA